MSKQNEMTQLGLLRSSRLSSGSNEVDELRKTTKLLLSSVLAKLELDLFDVQLNFGDQSAAKVTLEMILHYGQQEAGQKGDEGLVADIRTVIDHVLQLRASEDFGFEEGEDEDEDEEGGGRSENENEPDERLLQEVHGAYVQMNKSCLKVERNSERLKKALEAIEKQHDDLNDQIDTWRAYLENVKAQAMGKKEGGGKKGGGGIGGIGGIFSGKKNKDVKKKKDKVKFSYSELVKMNVIVRSNIPSSAQSSVYFTFKTSEDVPGMFVVVGSIKGLEASRATLLLEELLGEQERGKEELDMDPVTLHVNLLIHLLNSSFGNG